jgi:xanthine dehydrogenase accessory factor
MAVDESNAVIGSISGGCVEGEIIAVSEQIDASHPSIVTEFGLPDSAGDVDDVFAPGLNCGGQIEVLTLRLGGIAAGGVLSPALRSVLEAARDGQSTGMALIITGVNSGRIITLTQAEDTADARTLPTTPADFDVRDRIRAELRARIHNGLTATVELDCGGEPTRVLFLVSMTPPRLIIFGAVDFAAALSAAATLLGYRVTVCDARAVFATPVRFPFAHEVVVEWPADYLARTVVDSRTVVCVLSHDDKVDVPLLAQALALPVGYVGAMGSRRTHDRRLPRLQEAGVSDTQLRRLHSPIGLDLGASTPEETAISILAEVLAARTGAAGGSLRNRTGPIHVPIQVPESGPQSTQS